MRRDPAAAVGLGLSIAGLGVSAYLTVDHYTTIAVSCSSTGTVDCERVTTSPESMFLHIPVAVLGLVFFAAMCALYSPWTWGVDDPRLKAARLIAPIGGVAFALWLVYAELFIIGAVCLWCTVAHVLTFALLVLAAITFARPEPDRIE
jgi:uncharacterized membrane protein